MRRYCPDFEQPTHWSSIVRKAKTRLNKGKDLEEPIFSNCKVSDIGPCCQKLNIHVNDLHSNLTTLSTGHPLTVGAFHEITKIRGKLNKTWQDIACVVNRIKPTSFPSFTQQRINYFANRISHQAQTFSKNKNVGHIEHFKGADFFSFTKLNINQSNSRPICSCSPKDLTKMNKKLIKLSKELANEHERCENENTILHDTIKEKNEELKEQNLDIAKLNDMNAKVRKLKTKNKVLNERLIKKQSEVTSLKKQNYIKRLQRQHKSLKTLSESRKTQVDRIKKKYQISKKMRKNYKLQITEAKSHLDKIKFEHKKSINRYSSKVNYWKQEAMRKKRLLFKVRNEKEDLKQTFLAEQRQEFEVENIGIPIITKEDNKYTDDMRMCVMDLQSLDISNNKIGSVIKSIGQNIFKQQLETPCKTTIQNIADEALALSKQHVAEKLTQSENFGFFSDGTSREGRKIIDIGVNLNDSTLSLGYKVVATEDAQTVSGIIFTTRQVKYIIYKNPRHRSTKQSFKKCHHSSYRYSSSVSINEH